MAYFIFLENNFKNSSKVEALDLNIDLGWKTKLN